MTTQIRHIANRFFRSGLLLLLGGCCLAGCNRSPLGAGEGTLSLAFERNEELTVKGAVSAAASDAGYALDIVNEAGDTVAHYNDHRTVASIRLAEGIYTVHAADNGKNGSGERFGRPRYGGRQTVTVVAGRNTPVLMTCKLINVKVKVEEFEQAIRDNFTEYSLTIKPTWEYTGRDTLTFTQAEVDAGQEGWINQTERGRFVLIFRAINRQEPDRRQVYVRTIADAEGADFYRFRVRMNPVGSVSDGGAMFRLSVRTDAAEYEFPLELKEETRPVPVVTRADGGNVREPIMTNVDVRAGNARLDISAAAGIRRLRIRHEDAAVLLTYGLPGMITLGGGNDAATDEAQRTEMLGIVAWEPGSMVGRTKTWVDFSELINTAKGKEGEHAGRLLPEGLYPVELEIYDDDNQMVKQRIVLSVARDFSTDGALASELVNGVPGVGAKYAYVRAKWLGTAQPAGLGFEYRPAGTGDGAWVTVQGAAVSVDAAAKSFVGLLKGLVPETRYEFRPIGDGLVPGSVGTFVTDAWIEIPYMDFDNWYQGSAGSGITGASDVWFANPAGQPMFWATGNPGTKAGVALKINITEPTDDAVSGKAVKMVSKSGVPMTKHAAGNIYAGDFVTNISNPASSAKMGRPYTGRPLALKGYYKYTSTPIEVGDAYIDQPDKGTIYMYLEDWGQASLGPGERPANAEIIAEGVLLIEEDKAEYTPFVIPLTYTSATKKPTHVRLVASSSYMGEQFIGGNGSTLFVDEFELVWEPSVN